MVITDNNIYSSYIYCSDPRDYYDAYRVKILVLKITGQSDRQTYTALDDNRRNYLE